MSPCRTASPSLYSISLVWTSAAAADANNSTAAATATMYVRFIDPSHSLKQGQGALKVSEDATRARRKRKRGLTPFSHSQHRLTTLGLTPSMSRKGNCY